MLVCAGGYEDRRQDSGKIDPAIRCYDNLVLVLSRDSVHSEWVKDGVETALEREQRRRGKQVLFPVRIDDAVMRTRKAWAGKIRRQRLIGDFTQWKDHDAYQTSFQLVLRDLQSDGRSEVTEWGLPHFP